MTASRKLAMLTQMRWVLSKSNFCSWSRKKCVKWKNNLIPLEIPDLSSFARALLRDTSLLMFISVCDQVDKAVVWMSTSMSRLFVHWICKISTVLFAGLKTFIEHVHWLGLQHNLMVPLEWSVCWSITDRTQQKMKHFDLEKHNKYLPLTSRVISLFEYSTNN